MLDLRPHRKRSWRSALSGVEVTMRPCMYQARPSTGRSYMLVEYLLSYEIPPSTNLYKQTTYKLGIQQSDSRRNAFHEGIDGPSLQT